MKGKQAQNIQATNSCSKTLISVYAHFGLHIESVLYVAREVKFVKNRECLLMLLKYIVLRGLMANCTGLTGLRIRAASASTST